MADNKNNRRDFLKKAALSAAAFYVVPRHVIGGANYTAPSDKLVRAVIGVGGMGQGHLGYFGDKTKLAAICDVDRNRLMATKKKLGGNVDTYADFRQVLERKDIDFVQIVTPPHWHGVMASAAAKAGKDVFCEKPMTRTIGEGKQLVETVQKHGRIFRLNTWFRFRDTFYGLGTDVKPLKKVIDSGVLGWPLKVTVSGVTGYNWKFFWSGKTNLPQQQVPEELDYDMWLGPAPYKPYHRHRTHSTFRGYWDYDGGGLGDMGQHYLDPVQYMLGKDNDSPISVEIDAPQQHHDAIGSWRRIEYTYADGCKVILDGENRDKEASYIEGPNGRIYLGFKSDIPNIDKLLETLPDPEPQETDFLKCIKERKKFALNEENGHRSCTIVNMGVVAHRLGRNLKFDPVKQEFIDDEGANRLLYEPMRGSWRV
ncbi:oxidoreductase (plasmid) [Fulvitalea axinellae]|uniref:Oxidoreductase n=1 Tax=Fulvitalea axinellae TaxID=1182444 RepID=A0AAU9CZA7_9BACT|nr:oxidoreductase [Fulvitalea axinellae]